MEGRKSPSGVAALAGEGGELGNAATKRQMEAGIEDQKEEGDRAVVTADGQGLAVAGMKRKRGAEDADWSGRENSGQESQLSPVMLVEPPTLVPLQELVNACRAVFNGTSIPPTDDAVSFIRGVMDKMGMFDVGLMDEIGFFLHRNLGPQNPPVLTCKTIYKCANYFMVAVLYLPTGAAMPLHDHPGMTVFTKLLVGLAHIEAYDWVRPRVCAAAGPGSAMLAEKVRDDHLTARSAGAWVLFPDSGGNMHRFVAGQDGPCVFLKVFTPLYSAAEQQRCAFYQYSPYEFDLNVMSYEVTEEKRRRLAWVRKIDEPKDVINIVSLPYRGRPIV